MNWEEEIIKQKIEESDMMLDLKGKRHFFLKLKSNFIVSESNRCGGERKEHERDGEVQMGRGAFSQLISVVKDTSGKREPQ